MIAKIIQYVGAATIKSDPSRTASKIKKIKRGATVKIIVATYNLGGNSCVLSPQLVKKKVIPIRIRKDKKIKIVAVIKTSSSVIGS
jgi:hypothetical protein